MPLTPKQAQFAGEYLLDSNATQAAIRAGYSERTASSQGERLLRNVEIAAAVAVGQATRAARLEIDQDWVVTRLIANHDRAMQAEAVTDREGNETGVYTYEGAVANKALELIGKHLGMFGDRVDFTSGGKPVQGFTLALGEKALGARGR